MRSAVQVRSSASFTPPVVAGGFFWYIFLLFHQATDGAYSGKANHDLAAEKNIRLINKDLSGKPVEDILADFVFNEFGTKVLRCPAGYEPKSCGYTGGRSQQFHVSFTRDQCAGCPNKDRCKAKLHKRVSSVTVSIKAHERAKQQRFMGTEEFCNLFQIRNGVETVNVKTFETYQPLNESELETLWKAKDAYMDDMGIPCSACRYCCPTCPAQLDIPLLIRGYNEKIISGNNWRVAFLDSAKSASECLQCGSCLKMCPQKIDIPEIMRQIADA